MKWPKEITLIRHAESTYNVNRRKLTQNTLYQEFLESYNKDWQSAKTKQLAINVALMLGKNNGEETTSITPAGKEQAYKLAEKLKNEIEIPHTIYLSPFLRTRETYEQMLLSWPELKQSRIIIEDRIRELDFGLRLLYGDWRVMQVLHPEQRPLYQLQGEYWYRQPQGESIADLRERNRSWISALHRTQSGKRVLAITHHITILAFKANIERLSPDKFIEMRRSLLPENCSVTKYNSVKNKQEEEWLELEYFNKSLT